MGGVGGQLSSPLGGCVSLDESILGLAGSLAAGAAVGVRVAAGLSSAGFDGACFDGGFLEIVIKRLR